MLGIGTRLTCHFETEDCVLNRQQPEPSLYKRDIITFFHKDLIREKHSILWVGMQFWGSI